MRAQLPMPGVSPRRHLSLALQNESRMPAMPRRVLERSRRDARRDVSRLRGGGGLFPLVLGDSRADHAPVRRRPDFYSQRDRMRQRAALLPAHPQRLDRTGVSLGRNRTPAPAHNPGRQKVRLTRFRLPGSAFRTRSELLLKAAQPLGGRRDRLVALGKGESNLAMSEFRPMVEA